MTDESGNEITGFVHCRACQESKPDNFSPSEWEDIEAGFTERGFQIWCKRHDVNIIHMAAALVPVGESREA